MSIVAQGNKSTIHQLACSRALELVIELQAIYEQLQVDKNQETKSTAGDKHEVGRAMLQIEEEKLQKQINEAQRNYNVLNQLSTDECHVAKLGALVQTNRSVLYISSAIGKIAFNNSAIMCVSVQAPIAAALANKKVGDTVHFNGIELQLLSIS